MNWRELSTDLDTPCRHALEQKKPDPRGYTARHPIGIKFKQLRRFCGVISLEGGPSFGGRRHVGALMTQPLQAAASGSGGHGWVRVVRIHKALQASFPSFSV